jgi:hypothetical protein
VSTDNLYPVSIRRFPENFAPNPICHGELVEP